MDSFYWQITFGSDSSLGEINNENMCWSNIWISTVVIQFYSTNISCIWTVSIMVVTGPCTVNQAYYQIYTCTVKGSNCMSTLKSTLSQRYMTRWTDRYVWWNIKAGHHYASYVPAHKTSLIHNRITFEFYSHWHYKTRRHVKSFAHLA